MKRKKLTRLRENKIDRYIRNSSCSFVHFNDLKRFIAENDDYNGFDLFDGCETGGLYFGRSKSGRRYIKKITSRCYLD